MDNGIDDILKEGENDTPQDERSSGAKPYTWVPVVLKRLAYIEARLEGMESQLERMEKAHAELRYLLSQLPAPRGVPRRAWERVWNYVNREEQDPVS